MLCEFYRKTLWGEKPLKPMSITPRDTQYFCDDESFFYQFFFMAVQKVSFFFNTAYFFFVLTRLISVMSMAQFWRHNSFFFYLFNLFLAIGTRSCINIKEAKM